MNALAERISLVISLFHQGSVLAAAEALSEPQRSLQRVATGQMSPRADLLEKLTRVYGLDPSWLLTGTGEPPTLPDSAEHPWSELLRLRQLLDAVLASGVLSPTVAELLFNHALQMHALAARYLPREYRHDDGTRDSTPPTEITATVQLAERRYVRALTGLVGAMLTFPPGSAGRSHPAVLKDDEQWLAKHFPLSVASEPAPSGDAVQRIAEAIAAMRDRATADLPMHTASKSKSPASPSRNTSKRKRS